MEEITHNELLAIRRQKLNAIREANIDPYGARFETTGTPGLIRAEFVEGLNVRTAGRITAHRNMGKSHFIDLSDISGRIQIYINSKEIGPDSAAIFEHLDIGDFIGVDGQTFTTKTGEPSIKATAFTVLSKSLRPLPDKWHGVQDTEIKYRQR